MDRDKSYDVIIVGGGAAGPSAALVLGRAATDTSVQVVTAVDANNTRSSDWKRLRQAKSCRLGQVWE